MKSKVVVHIALALLLVVPMLLRADAIPYGSPGTIAATQSFTATTTGPIVAYFYGANAADTSEIGVLVNGVFTGILGLPNHGSSPGQSLVLGNVNAGDQITFELFDESRSTTWYSNPTMNSDHVNHVYSTTFSGNSTIPAGLYLGFEDLPKGLADFDYDDAQYVITNVAFAGSVPEPGSLALFGGGLLGLAGMVRKRSMS